VLATDVKNEAGDITKSTVWLLLVRGDHSLNEIKAGKVRGLKDGFRFATVAEIEDHFGCKPGYLGPDRRRASRSRWSPTAPWRP
jgi:prolyl-tRNA synthetase